MPRKQAKAAPIEAVGGPQERGPWPKDLEEIAVDDRLQRPVIHDGEPQQVEVKITNIQQHVRADGTETDGYSVAFQYSDSALGGG